MIAATLFSGIGAPEVAMPAWDWRWHAEIEPFPAAVMAARHPESVNLGDATAHDFTARAAALGPVDVVVFGSPCQSYSIAGKRLGLDDPRGNLALVALGILGILRPRWFVYENVPGLLSSWSGAEDDPDEGIDACTQSSDFDAFRGHVDDIGYSGAWAVLDAQFFGVAQRRRRVFFVGHLGPDWRRPAAVLLEPDRVCGDSPARGRARKDVAGTLRAGAENGGCGPTVDDAAAGQLIVHTLRGEGFDASEDGTGRGVPLVVDSNQITSRVNRSQPARDMTHTLPVAANSPLVFGPVTATYAKTVSRGSKNAGAMDNHVIEPVAYALGSHASCADGEATNRSHASGGPVGLGISEDVAHCLRAGRVQAVAMSGVRRLMPIECERLQGFPDHFTAITYRGAPAKDGPRYRAIGNSMAVPVIRWIMERIEWLDTHVPARSDVA